MPTNIFNYNGTKLTTVQDGRIDTTSSSIKFPGYGYINYGEAVNENMLWIMQNFAGSNSPTNPVIGQTWYNTTDDLLKIWTGSEWTDVGGIIQSSTAPTSTKISSLWYDTNNRQLKMWNGVEWVILGPLGSYVNSDPTNPAVPNYSQLDSVRLLDGSSMLHQAWRVVIGGTILAIISKDPEFSPNPSVSGFNTIKPGINLNSTVVNASFNGDSSIFRNNQSNIPNLNGTYDLGSSSFKFGKVHANEMYATSFIGKATAASNADISSIANVASDSNNFGGLDPTKYLGTNKNDIPDANLAYDLGSASRQWKNLYAGNIYLNGTILNPNYNALTSLTGTANQVIVSGAPTTPILSLPQSIATASSVRFSAIGLNQSPGAAGTVTFGDGSVQSTAAIPGPSYYNYDISSSPPGAYITLGVNDRMVLRFNSLPNVFLYTNAVEGVYKVILSVYYNTNNNVDIAWYPNDTTGISDYFEATAIVTNTTTGSFDSVPQAQAVTKQGRFWFDLVAGPGDAVSDRGPFMLEFLASTYTAAKMIKASTSITLGTSINTGIWLNGDGLGSPRINTTTPWTSLGFITIDGGTTMSGSAIVERLA